MASEVQQDQWRNSYWSLKELPQEECPEQANAVSEQHGWAEKPPGGQWTKYPQCCLEDLNRDVYRRLAVDDADVCTREMPCWLEVQTKLDHLVPIQGQRIIKRALS